MEIDRRRFLTLGAGAAAAAALAACTSDDAKSSRPPAPDVDGALHPTWDNGDDWQGCRYEDPGHQWPQGKIQLNDGKADGFLFTQVREGQTTPVDLWPISYYGSH